MQLAVYIKRNQDLYFYFFMRLHLKNHIFYLVAVLNCLVFFLSNINFNITYISFINKKKILLLQINYISFHLFRAHQDLILFVLCSVVLLIPLFLRVLHCFCFFFCFFSYFVSFIFSGIYKRWSFKS